MNVGENGIIIAGAGLAGSLAAIFLKKRGYDVHVLESRSDLRDASLEGGRSINLILTSRGINALDALGMAAEVSDITVPVYGREMHAINGEKTYQPYGPSEKYCNYSVSRTQLNIALMNAAEKAGAKLYFNRSVASVDLADSASTERGNAKTSPRVTVNVTHSIDTSSDKSHTSSPSEMVSLTQTFTAPHIIGADGAGSKCRRAMKAVLGSSMQDDSVPLNSAYKELQMPAARDGSYIINKDALHIWPRGSHFLMALPDLDGTFTVTLYLKGKSTHSGDLLSFEALNTPERVLGYFKQYYPDTLPLIPDLIKDFFGNRTGFLGTIYCNPWYYQDKMVLVGDAAHAIVPFFGQGCNSAFEGVHQLDKLIAKASLAPSAMSPSSPSVLAHGVVGDAPSTSPPPVLGRAFKEFFDLYKANGDAIAAMAVENYYEMMDKTASPVFLLKKAVEIRLSQSFPGAYLSRYAMVTHTLIPYSVCFEAGKIQQEIIDSLCTTITSAEQVDMKRAKHMIDTKLTPFLHSHGIASHDFHDNSWDIMNRHRSGSASTTHTVSTLKAKL